MRHALQLSLFVVVGLSFGAPSWAEPLVRIGVLATAADRQDQERWEPTAAYLARQVPGYAFEFVALDPQAIRRGVQTRTLDFVLTDAGLFVDIRHRHDLRPIATRRVLSRGRGYAHFSAVILTRVDRSDITDLADLRGRSLIAAHNEFGSFHLAWRELQHASIRPFRDLSSLELDQRPAERILLALRDGNFDAAVVPAGTLEELIAREDIDATAFRVLNPQIAGTAFPFRRSTPLYPEWPLAAGTHVPVALSAAVSRALHAMAPDDPAARAAGNAGWAPPPSYEPVADLYRELGLEPFDEIPLAAFVRNYWPIIAMGMLTLVALIAVALHIARVNRKLADAVRRGAVVREQLQTFASAVEQTADAVMITDPKGAIEYVNPAFSRVTGYTLQEVRGRTPALLKSGRHDALFYRQLWDTISDGRVFADEFINRRKDGVLFWEQKTIMPLRDARGHISHFVATGRDVTEQRQAEEEVQLRREQLAHTARVNIIGEMAASIAHEISQPLTAVINYAQGSIRRLRGGDTDHQRLLGVFEHVVTQAQRAADAIVTLRRFVSRHKPQRVRADINALVTQTAALAAGETRKRGIAIRLELGEHLPPVSVDDVQIEQVILNLLRNGAEALASADSAARELKLRTATADDGSIEVSISDTGPGLSPRLAAKLFEPFFTTKPDSVGLGLPISRSIIENHGGRIWVTPNPERGVTFRFTIPVETQTHEQ